MSRAQWGAWHHPGSGSAAPELGHCGQQQDFPAHCLQGTDKSTREMINGSSNGTRTSFPGKA